MKKINKSRFSLMFNKEKKEFVIIIDNNIIYEAIFKKEGKWYGGYGLAMGKIVENLKYIAPFNEWRKAYRGIEIIEEATNKTFTLPQTEIEEIKKLIRERDKRIKT